MNLARFALRNPVTILMAVLGAIILGAISFTKLPVDMFPEITYPSITVGTFYPGPTPRIWNGRLPIRSRRPSRP